MSKCTPSFITRRSLPQVLRIHLPLAASEEIDCGEAEDEHPDDVSPRFGPTPERALERLRDVVRVDQVAQLARRCYLPEKNQSTLIIGGNPIVKDYWETHYLVLVYPSEVSSTTTMAAPASLVSFLAPPLTKMGMDMTPVRTKMIDST